MYLKWVIIVCALSPSQSNVILQVKENEMKQLKCSIEYTSGIELKQLTTILFRKNRQEITLSTLAVGIVTGNYF